MPTSKSMVVPLAGRPRNLYLDSSIVGNPLWFPQFFCWGHPISNLGWRSWPFEALLWWRGTCHPRRPPLYMAMQGKSTLWLPSQKLWRYMSMLCLSLRRTVEYTTIKSLIMIVSHAWRCSSNSMVYPPIEGVLGRTYQPDFQNPAKSGVAMPVVGGEDKYRITSLISA